MILIPFIIPTATVGCMIKTHDLFLFRFLRNKVPLGNAFVRYRLPPSPPFVKVDMDLAAAALRAWYIISHGSEGDLQDHINSDNSGEGVSIHFARLINGILFRRNRNLKNAMLSGSIWKHQLPDQLPAAPISSPFALIVSPRQANSPTSPRKPNKKSQSLK